MHRLSQSRALINAMLEGETFAGVEQAPGWDKISGIGYFM
jgi:hypothetical protein